LDGEAYELLSTLQTKLEGQWGFKPSPSEVAKYLFRQLPIEMRPARRDPFEGRGQAALPGDRGLAPVSGALTPASGKPAMAGEPSLHLSREDTSSVAAASLLPNERPDGAT
jgi:hypothetical protein